MTPRRGLAFCVTFLIVFAGLAGGSVLTKSATFDEPVQSVAGWLRLHRGDFRLDIEDPPLWEEWAALPNGPAALHPETQPLAWNKLPSRPDFAGQFASRALFGTPGVDGAQFVNRSRAMMLVIGVLLGALIAFWAWRVGGPIAGVIAVGLYSLDPNFLAHAPLVKNDVASSFMFLAVALVIWRLGQRVTPGRIMLLAVLCGLAATVKFSAVLLVPIVVLLLLIRTLSPQPWPVFSRTLQSRPERFFLSTVLLAIAGVTTWLTIWAAYDFRFAGTPDGYLDPAWVLDHLMHHQVAGLRGAFANVRPEDLAAWHPDRLTRAVLWARGHHLLPEAWLDGFLYTYSTTLMRLAFLFNQLSDVGWWYYFPVAVLFKMPLATLAAIIGAIIFGAWIFRGRPRSFDEAWTTACITAPPAFYLLYSLRSHMNIGLRHILPVYAFAFVACGVVGAATLRRWRRPAALTIGGLAVALSCETLAATPDFIPFFNSIAGGPTGGINLLSDSNLDWGQDLKQLAEWQQRHPDVNLYLSYFGMVDPAFYGIRYRALPGNYMFGPPPTKDPIEEPAIFAVSASHMQGLSVGVDVRDTYAIFRSQKPREILGGTIYLFDAPPP